MFNIANVPTVLRRLTLSLEEDSEGDLQTVCTCAFRIPVLTFEIAGAVLHVPVMEHCFVEDGRPSWSVDEVTFAKPPGHFGLEVRIVPDMDGIELPLVTVDTIKVTRPKKDKRDLRLEFQTKHEIPGDDVRDLANVLKLWRSGQVYVTFRQVQLSLLPGREQ